MDALSAALIAAICSMAAAISYLFRMVTNLHRELLDEVKVRSELVARVAKLEGECKVLRAVVRMPDVDSEESGTTVTWGLKR